MPPERGVSSLAIDLTRLLRRTVTSFYSNLVTRPTGRAIRTGVESQIVELEAGPAVCLSVLDFSQVHVLDYSCADEIVAKLLLRFASDDRPADAYFVARGLLEHHREAVEAVLERHDLLLVTEDEAGRPELLGPSNPVERACWGALADLGRPSGAEVAEATGLTPPAVGPALSRLVSQRVALPLSDGRYCALSILLRIQT
jgi:hypothetical protein